MEKITLSNGVEVQVYPVPPFALSAIEARYSEPEMPEGDRESLEWRRWVSELRQARAQREQAVTEAALLVALRDVELPEGWRLPEAFRLAGFQEREGERGRRLDYVQYELLIAPGDLVAVQSAMYGSTLTEEEVKAAEATFPSDSQREIVTSHSTG